MEKSANAEANRAVERLSKQIRFASYCVVLTFESAKIQWLVKEILVFGSIDIYFFMDDDSEHKVDDSDDGWVLDSEQIWKEESEIVSESDGNTAMLLLKCEHFYQVLPALPQLRVSEPQSDLGQGR